MSDDSFQAAVDAGADSEALAHYVVDTLAAFTDGKHVTLDFLSTDAVGSFCRSIGIRRNWADFDLDELAPADEFGVNTLPTGEADKVLGLTAALIEEDRIKPRNKGKAAPTVLNDFLQKPKRFQGSPTLGHLDEFAYALAVELEHARDRGQNVTMNHPLLTSMVVLAHLSEDSLYYARHRVMEAEGDLFTQLLDGSANQQLLACLVKLEDARGRLTKRLAEKLDAAKPKT